MNRTIRSINAAAFVIILWSALAAPAVRAATVTFIRPVHGTTVLRFGAKYIDAAGKVRGHHGIDINANEGVSVTASAPGMVVFAGSTPNGPCVSIVHPGAIKTTYLPLTATRVVKGDKVQTGQIIGFIGSPADPSGKSSHLHMGAIFAGKYIDPESLFKGEFHPDLSKVIRRANIPPVDDAGCNMSPVAAAVIGIPGFFRWLWDETVSLFESLTSGAESAWTWLWSVSTNTASFLWNKLVKSGGNLLKLIAGTSGSPLGITTSNNGFYRPSGLLGFGEGLCIFDPSGDASEEGNHVSIELSSLPARVEVFSADGDSVWMREEWEAGGNTVFWTGIDNRGRIVPNGIYTVIIEYESSTEGFLAEAKWHN